MGIKTEQIDKLYRLFNELSEYNVEAKDLVEKLVPLFAGTPYAELINTLSTAVNSFDFDKGLGLLNRFVDELGMSL